MVYSSKQFVDMPDIILDTGGTAIDKTEKFLDSLAGRQKYAGKFQLVPSNGEK